MLGRSNTTTPAGDPEVTKKHIDRVNSRMNPILESIEATGSRSQPLNEDQMEVDPLPGIFCDTTMSSSSTASDSWMVGEEISDNDPEVINSIDDLERAFDDCLPNSSDTMDGIEGSDKDTLLKPEDVVSPLHKPLLHTSHSVHESPETLRVGLVAAQDHKHPKSDSGIGSTQGSPGNAFLYKEYKGPDYEGSGRLFFGELPSCDTGNPVKEVYNVRVEGSGPSRNGSPGSSSCTVEASETIANYNGHHESPPQLDEIHTSYGPTVFHHGEPTPPGSAIRSPSAYSSFEVRDFPKTKQLSRQSVEAMAQYILNPILLDETFEDFWQLCEQAKRGLFQGKICWLRDLEKFLFDGIPAVRSLSSYKAFCETFLSNCQRALPYIRELDQQRSYDPVYSSAYFIDALHRAKESADAWTAEKNKVMRMANYDSQSVSEELDTSGNNKSKLKDFVLLPNIISSEGRKRKMPIDIGHDESQMKRALTSNKAAGSAQPRLAIQTTVPLEYFDGYHDALPSSPLQVENIGYPLNPRFDFPPRVLTAAQSGKFSEYTHPSSESTAANATALLPSDVSGDHRVMTRHSIGYPQAPTPADTNYSGSPAAPAPFEGHSGSSHGTSRRKASVPAGKPDEEDAPIYRCDQCPREFPRPCDLTKHKKTHERPFKCDDEGCKYHIEGFPTNKERERHQNDIHVANSKEWKCTYSPCAYKSKRESNCKQHMEKAHGYNYKRMKRNPRKRPEQLTKPVTSDKKKRGAIRKASVATSRSTTVSKAIKASRPSRPEAPEVTALPGQDSNVAVTTGFDMYQGYPQSPAIHGTSDYQLLDPDMPPTSYFDGSPQTDFVPSPADAPMGYNPPMGAYQANHPMMGNSGWFSSQSSGFLDPFLPEFEQSSAPYDDGVGDDDTAD
ncbi:hypothetical protein HOY82DRAFT_493859 [Tuber indicum]|nr:hypothetical protein HOY82DRAFT_493859 [Tuber indicum]